MNIMTNDINRWIAKFLGDYYAELNDCAASGVGVPKPRGMSVFLAYTRIYEIR